MTSRALAIAAVLAILAAGFGLLTRGTPPTPPVPMAPVVTGTATRTAVPTPSPWQESNPAATPDLARTAERYAIAATNWSATTYAASRRHRTSLSAGPLERQLRQPLDAGLLRQLRRDQASRLGAVLDVSVIRTATRRADVRVVVDEIAVQAGLRTRQLVRYRVQLRPTGSRWRVIAFGAIRQVQP